MLKLAIQSQQVRYNYKDLLLKLTTSQNSSLIGPTVFSRNLFFCLLFKSWTLMKGCFLKTVFWSNTEATSDGKYCLTYSNFGEIVAWGTFESSVILHTEGLICQQYSPKFSHPSHLRCLSKCTSCFRALNSMRPLFYSKFLFWTCEPQITFWVLKYIYSLFLDDASYLKYV